MHRHATSQLKAIHCKHPAPYDTWGYKPGTSLAVLYCSKCGKAIRKVPVDDMGQKFIIALRDDNLKDEG